MNKKIMIPVVALTLTLISSSPVLAQMNSQHSSSLVQKIAQKFGLNEADVQMIFDEERQEQLSQRQLRFEQILNQAIKEGKLTDSQKQLIMAKRTEMETQREIYKNEFQDMTSEQIRMDMEAKRQELESWAKQHNIDVKYLVAGKPTGKGHKMIMR